jgi:hypothetical protein
MPWYNIEIPAFSYVQHTNNVVAVACVVKSIVELQQYCAISFRIPVTPIKIKNHEDFVKTTFF